MRKNLFLEFLILFLFSGCTPVVQRLSQTEIVYQEISIKSNEPLNVSYDLPVVEPIEQTKQSVVKGNVTITCQIKPFKAEKKEEMTKNITYADPYKPGYDVYEIKKTPYYEVYPDRIWFSVTVKNNGERILKLKDVAIVLLVDGVAYKIPEEVLQEWVTGMLVKGFEKTYNIAGPFLSGLSNEKIIYLSINDVPISYTDAGEIIRKENFEWYYKFSREKINKQENIIYSYEEQPILKEICTSCSGAGIIVNGRTCGYVHCKGGQYLAMNGKYYTCDICGGDGLMDAECNRCQKKGSIEYPKSKLPAEISRIDWNGWKVNVITNPPGATIYSVIPKIRQYRAIGTSNNIIEWYSSNSKSYPIEVELNGKKVKILPYNKKGLPIPKILIDYNTGTPTVKKGQVVQ